MDRQYMSAKDTENFSSGYYSSSNQNKEFDKNQGQLDLNLKNKLNNAFTDLESLRKALKDIRSNNDNILHNNDTKLKFKNTDKYDFFSDERYNNVLNQIKQSNQDKNMVNKIKSASRERLAANNSFGVFKSHIENSRDKSNYFIFKNLF